MKQLLLILIFAFSLPANHAFAQTREETAAKNFETFFTSFKEHYPADTGKTSFKNYSELWRRKAMPEELKLMIAYSQTFYEDYLFYIRNSRDTLIKISILEFTPSIKNTYTKFKQSVLAGEKAGKFNTGQDKEYSDNLKRSLDQVNLPVVGYYRSATAVVQSPDGSVQESKIIINYTNNLGVIDFTIVE